MPFGTRRGTTTEPFSRKRLCGRFTQNYTWEQVHAFLSVFRAPRNLQPHYNIAPTDTVEVIRRDKHRARELVPMRWGLVPAWWKKLLKEVPATFNARAESVTEKPMFRTAFKERRCIVPARGLRVLFAARDENREHPKGVGEFLAVPMTGAEIVVAVKRMLAEDSA
jgi:putative SOS response-associated peptidase YedK